MDKFDPKDPLEVIPLTFDFVALLDGQAISGLPVVAVTVFSGVDANPQNILSGAVSVAGDKVRQNVTGGVVDVEYLIRLTATTDAGLKYTIGKILPIKNAGTY